MKRSTKTGLLVGLVGVMTGVVWWQIPIEKRTYGLSQTAMTTDYTGLMPEKVAQINEVKKREELVAIVKEAQKAKRTISIAGLQHSQGGHTYYKDGIVIDMRAFNRVLSVNEQQKTVKVEAGASWMDVQEALAKKGLALRVTQSQSIFTIGGSLSVNAHGRDIRYGSMASTVRELTIVNAQGEFETLKRGRDDERLQYILGGYGLFGVIVDVTLDVTDNTVYTMHTTEMKMADYAPHMRSILKDDRIAMHYARISVAPNSFLEDVYTIDYEKMDAIDHTSPLKGESSERLSKLGLDLGRQGGALENGFWQLQRGYMKLIDDKEINRNDAMRSESTFMEYTKPGRVEVLQEFFVPLDEFEAYVNELQQVLPHDDKKNDVKVHNITLRYVAKDDATALNYATDDMMGFVVLLQHGTSEQSIEEAKTLIRQWTDVTLKHEGTYYLPYYPYQTTDQFKKAYPNAASVYDEKQHQDPDIIFRNYFYDNYVKHAND